MEFSYLLLLFKNYSQSFIIFFTGVLSGFIIFSLLYLFSIFSNFNKKFNIKKIENSKLSSEDMERLIQQKQNQFKKDNEKNFDNYMLSLLRNCQNLILEVSNSFYPESQFSYLELTIDESLHLIQYLHNRIEELFQKQIISLFKKMTLRKIMVLKKSLLNKKTIKTYKKTSKMLILVSDITNFINPFHWVKKIFFKTFYNKIFNKIGESIILILGEEIYKIYSKKIFEKNTDININDMIDELQKEIQNKQKNKT